MYILITLLISYLIFRFVKSFYAKKAPELNSLPHYYAYCALIWFLLSAFCLSLLTNGKTFLMLQLFLAALVLWGTFKFMSSATNARKIFEKHFLFGIKFTSLVSIAITFLILLSIAFESIRFFQQISIFDFIFGTKWSPQIAMRSDQAGASGSFGVIPVLAGTLLITFIAILIAVPFGLSSAIYLDSYCSPNFRKFAKPVLEILAGIPTVVYGYFAAFTVAPFIKNIASGVGINASAESALAAGLVMGIMIIPFVMSLSDDVMNAVPKSLRDASFGLGSTKSETIVKVVIPAALPGIIGAILLAISRAIGETMIVTMAAGLRANLTLNPLESVTTATAQIVTLLVGDQEFDSVKTLSAFALGLTLFLITLLLNVIALKTVKKYQEKYE